MTTPDPSLPAGDSLAERAKYMSIVDYCEGCLAQFGDNFRGVGWTKSQTEVDSRYQTMLDVIRDRPGARVTLLDFGCGASHFLEFIENRGLNHIDYSGVDLSPRFLELSRQKFPTVRYYQVDILRAPTEIPEVDYVILNGVFTLKGSMSFEEMFDYFKAVVARAFGRARIGIAFNVMSKQVQWERDDLFHLPFDSLATFLANEVSRHFVIRHDYGLYEYTAYVYRQPPTPPDRSGRL